MSSSIYTKLNDCMCNVDSKYKDTLPLESRNILTEWMHGLSICKAPEKGDEFPTPVIPLLYPDGKEFDFNETLKRGPLVISFNMAKCCEYCNTEKKVLNEFYDQITNYGATLISVGAELPQYTGESKKELGLKFDVLTDQRGSFAKDCGIAFEIETDRIYKAFLACGYDYPKYYGVDFRFYIVPATFVIGSDKKVVKAFYDRDHRKRLEPTDILGALNSLTSSPSQ